MVGADAAQTRSPLVSSAQTHLRSTVDYETSWLQFTAGRRKIGRNFNPEVGFIERADCIGDYVGANFKPRPKIHGVRELNFEGFIFHAPATNHVL